MQGQIINGFELKKLLGKGGMAEVWYAENEIGKPAAIKILNENLSHNQQIVERFHNEALVMVKLNHPNIRQVYGYGYLGERHCIIMEYLEGEDLEALMKEGRRFTDEELQRWWNQTVDALNYTHAMGIVHRDIKPSNIFLDEMGNIKLLDFGIAKMMENASLTQTGMVMGTPMYMSPEQVNDIKHVDYHTDLYSLAVSFVHMLTSKKPYDDTNCSVFEIQMSIVTKPLDLSEVPEAWRDFLTPYLAKAAAQRPQLKHFESVPVVEEPTPIVEKNEPTVVEQVKPSTMAKTEESTLVKEVSKPDAEPEAKPEAKPAPKPQPKKEASQPIAKPYPKPVETTAQTDELSEKPKSKKGLWIGIGAVALLAILLAIFISLGNGDEKYMQKGLDCVVAGNYEEALSWYKKAADKGNDQALWQIGNLYLCGDVGNDWTESLPWLTQAAEKGNMSAQGTLNSIESYDPQKVKVIMTSDTAMVTCGETYRVHIEVKEDVFMGKKAFVSIDGNSRKEYDFKSEFDIEYNAGVGEHHYNGDVEIVNPHTHQVDKFPFEGGFWVVPPGYWEQVEKERKAKEEAEKIAKISVSTTKNKNNVVYTGIDNPIVVKGISPKEMTVTAEGASLTKINEEKAALWFILRVSGNPSNVVINVNSQGSVLCSKKLPVKGMLQMKPKPRIYNVVDGQVRKSALHAAGGVCLEIKDCNYDGVRFEVTGYTCEYRPVGGIPSEIKVNGSKFNNEVNGKISASYPGDVFVFKNIRVKGNDAKEGTIDDQLTITIK